MYTLIDLHIYTNLYVYIYPYTYICIHVYIYVCIHITHTIAAAPAADMYAYIYKYI